MICYLDSNFERYRRRFCYGIVILSDRDEEKSDGGY